MEAAEAGGGGWDVTEQEWLSSKSPSSMLTSMLGTPSDRKLRLFAVACCKKYSSLFEDSRELKGIDAAEKLADEELTEAEREHIQEGLYDFRDFRFDTIQGVECFLCLPCEILNPEFLTTDATNLSNTVLDLAWHSLDRRARSDASSGGHFVAQARFAWDFFFPAQSRSRSEARRRELADRVYCDQARIIRDIFGNPFRPVACDLQWRTSDVLGLARAIYEDRAFDRMPILADALMDAGCADEQILGHCRGDGLHVRGCWVVDLVLGKQ